MDRIVEDGEVIEDLLGEIFASQAEKLVPK